MNKLLEIIRTRGVIQTSSALGYHLFGLVLSFIGFRFIKKKIYGRPMLLDLQDKGISRTLWLFGERELDHKWILEKTLKNGATMLDIGANIGYYVLLEYGLLGQDGKIIAVEPSPSNLDILEKNLTLNKISNIQVLPNAVSNVSGQKPFWLAAQSNLNSFDKEHLAEAGDVLKSINVDVITVRELILRYGLVDYIRMDIEGHEVEVLRDIIELGKSGFTPLPDIIFETHNRTYGEGRNLVDEIEQLFQLGYKLDYAASSSVRGTKKLEGMGLKSIKKIRTDDTYRTIHTDLNLTHLKQCLNRSGGLRTLFLKFHG